MIAVRRLTCTPDVWKYLLRDVAKGDGAGTGHGTRLAAYYAASGTPAGRWCGAGIADLGGGRGVRPGSVVTAEQLRRMLEQLADPLTGEPAGLRSRAPGARAVVAGFDLTFSVPKSVSVAWALADRGTKDVIYACHREAVQIVLAWAEEHVLRSRSGRNGVVEEDITGAVAAAFTHWASRSDDPQLHDHVVLWNRARSVSDGAWRTLDSRALFKAVTMLSELHHGVLEDLLTAALGVGWEARARRHSDRPRYEVAGVGEDLMAEFSRRATQAAAAERRLREQFAAAHGRQPTAVEQMRIRQQAVLETRPGKSHRSLAELTAQWRARAARFVPVAEQVAWVASLAARRGRLRPLRSADLNEEVVADTAQAVVEQVASLRTVFSRANLATETHRVLHAVTFTSPGERMAFAERVVEAALAASIPLSDPETAPVPRQLGQDSPSRLRPASRLAYTSSLVWEAEARLLAARDTTTGPGCDPAQVACLLAGPLPGRGTVLAGDQAAAVARVATSGRVADLLIGPAGTGKTTALAGLRAVWEAAHGPGSVLGLAPTAAAAEVLAAELGVPAENTAKWLWEWRRVPGLVHEQRQAVRRAAASGHWAARARWEQRAAELTDMIAQRSLRSQQLVIVDEASMAGTVELDELVTAASHAGAKVVLVGDPAQLASVSAGGALRLLAGEWTPPQLRQVHRFAEDWEKRASLELRAGNPEAVSVYAAHGRVTGGTKEEMLDAAFAAWQADMAAGRTSVMIAADNASVAELNARAHAGLVAAGRAAAGGGCQLSDGTTATAGDTVVTRRNDRRLRDAHGGWVRNGDRWTVVAAHEDGSMTVRRDGGGQVTLPAGYVTADVALGYAVTAHRAEGSTVDTAHALVSGALGPELLYVAATRGRQANHLYVDTSWDPDPASGHPGLAETRSPADVLTAILARDPAELPAHEAATRSARERRDVPVLAAEYVTIAALAEAGHWQQVITACLPPASSEQVITSTGWRDLVTACRAAAAAGLPVDGALPRLAAGVDTSSEDPAAMLAQQVQRWAESAGAPSGQPGPGRVAGLIPRPAAVTDPDYLAALTSREQAITTAASSAVDRALSRGEPWVTALGPRPADPVTAAQWAEQAAVAACYRLLYRVPGADPRPLGDPALARSAERAGHYRLAAAAAALAARLAANPKDARAASGPQPGADMAMGAAV